MTRLLAESNDGSYITGISDLGGNLDILASLRNTQELLTDLYDNPDMVIFCALFTPSSVAFIFSIPLLTLILLAFCFCKKSED